MQIPSISVVLIMSDFAQRPIDNTYAHAYPNTYYVGYVGYVCMYRTGNAVPSARARPPLWTQRHGPGACQPFPLEFWQTQPAAPSAATSLPPWAPGSCQTAP